MDPKCLAGRFISKRSADPNMEAPVTRFSHGLSPNLSSAMVAWMSPVSRVSSTALLGCPSTTGKHSRDMMAVGPRVMSLEVPRRVYMKPPMKAE